VVDLFVFRVAFDPVSEGIVQVERITILSEGGIRSAAPECQGKNGRA
jgi:hypothetical protein